MVDPFSAPGELYFEQDPVDLAFSYGNAIQHPENINNTISGIEYIPSNITDDARHNSIPNPHNTGGINIKKIFIPLNFWFCRNPGLALPLIALQYHEVKIKLQFESIFELIKSNDESNGQKRYVTSIDTRKINLNNFNISNGFTLWVDYIYLDTDERRRFSQSSHEYLIEQIQTKTEILKHKDNNIKLNFNHPVKELIWVMRNETYNSEISDSGGRNINVNNLNQGHGDPTASPTSIDTFGGNWKLVLNGLERFKKRDSKYFTRTQIWQHHSGYGSLPTYGRFGRQLNNGKSGSSNGINEKNNVNVVGYDAIAVYSFALKPEEQQPSGSCNFSRIDNAELRGTDINIHAANGSGLTFLPLNNQYANNTKIIIFAVNYNVLRIMSGMGGLAYSN